MDRFYEMQTFIAVAEEEGFAAAARRMNVSPATVTRAIASMEARIGTQLLSRTTRSLSLSDAGKRYLVDCRRILEDLQDAEQAAAGSYKAPHGNLTLTAPAVLGELLVAPLMVGYMERYPDVTINALFTDRLVSLSEEGMDIAVRVGHLREHRRQAVKVGEASQVICASPDYLNRVGRPRHPRELEKHKIVTSSASRLVSDWHYWMNDRINSVEVEPQLVVSDNKVAIGIAKSGWGVTRALSYQVADDVSAGELEIILADYQLNPVPVNIIVSRIERPSKSVNTFVEHLVEGMASALASI
ncbi:LysR substrate-binding domain-containing protein [Pseudomonas sp. NPDC090208]|uniref:LysR substrate-binding domain-containing protein n=1 Tax=Pseudomonas sp. NPDC090208 TaxID=3364478 RepID=UPI00381B4201